MPGSYIINNESQSNSMPRFQIITKASFHVIFCSKFMLITVRHRINEWTQKSQTVTLFHTPSIVIDVPSPVIRFPYKLAPIPYLISRGPSLIPSKNGSIFFNKLCLSPSKWKMPVTLGKSGALSGDGKRINISNF